MGVDPQSFLVLSRKDNPQLRTFDDIVAALPTGVKHVVLDDGEYLLPLERRDPESVKRFMGRMKGRYGHLGFNVMVTATGTNPVLTTSLIHSGRLED